MQKCKTNLKKTKQYKTNYKKNTIQDIKIEKDQKRSKRNKK